MYFHFCGETNKYGKICGYLPASVSQTLDHFQNSNIFIRLNYRIRKVHLQFIIISRNKPFLRHRAKIVRLILVGIAKLLSKVCITVTMYFLTTFKRAFVETLLQIQRAFAGSNFKGLFKASNDRCRPIVPPSTSVITLSRHEIWLGRNK